MNEEIRFDLFELHDMNDKGQGRIKVVLNPKLSNIIRKLINELVTKKGLKKSYISKIIGTNYNTLYHDLNDYKKLSLISLRNLLELWSKSLNKTKEESKKTKIDILNSIKKLTYGAGNTHKTISAPRFLTMNLCKIAGAIVADGNLNSSNFQNGYPKYIIDIKDQYKDGIELFAEWIKQDFLTDVKIVHDEEKNLWRISFANKIIYRYLNRIFEIPNGKKSLAVRMSPLIKYSNIKFQISFLRGVSMFDGGIGFRRPYFNISSKSFPLLLSLAKIMKKIDIDPNYFPNKPNKNNVYEIRVYERNKLIKCLDRILIKNSTKWNQLNFLMNGPKNKTLSEIISELDLLFPKVKNAITYSTIIKIIEDKNNITAKRLEEISKKNKKLLYDYLENLERWNVLTSKRETNKVWKINPNLKKEVEKIPKKDMTERIVEIMKDPTRIRNIATSSHVHHGSH